MKRKKVYDPKEAIKQQKVKVKQQSTNKENNNADLEMIENPMNTSTEVFNKAIQDCMIKQDNTRKSKTPDALFKSSKPLNSFKNREQPEECQYKTDPKTKLSKL